MPGGGGGGGAADRAVAALSCINFSYPGTKKILDGGLMYLF